MATENDEPIRAYVWTSSMRRAQNSRGTWSSMLFHIFLRGMKFIYFSSNGYEKLNGLIMPTQRIKPVKNNIFLRLQTNKYIVDKNLWANNVFVRRVKRNAIKNWGNAILEGEKCGIVRPLYFVENSIII